ncbi:MAG: radical SAM protein [Bryobacteraceae bacterium]
MRRGLAQAAAEAPLLLGKARVEYLRLPAASLLNRCSAGSLMPFQWTINPYRGCELGCHYCYARYTHEFLELDAGVFERRIFVKQFRRDSFERELRAVSSREWIAIGTATDPYQPAERRFGVTRAVLEVLSSKAGLQIALTTKSDLVARDAELLERASRRNRVRVNFTVTTLDCGLARVLEPGAPRPDLRLGALERLARAGVETAVFVSPVLPGINDGPGELENVARAASEAGAKHFGAQMLFLREPARTVFFRMLEENFPRRVDRYRRLFAGRARVPADLRRALELRVARIREECGFGGLEAAPAPAWGQLPLFEAPDVPARERQSPLIELRTAVAAARTQASAG